MRLRSSDEFTPQLRLGSFKEVGGYQTWWRSGRDSNSRTELPRLRHFQCRALDRTRRPLRSLSILSAVLVRFARTPALARGPVFEVEDGVDHAQVGEGLREISEHLPV